MKAPHSRPGQFAGMCFVQNLGEHNKTNIENQQVKLKKVKDFSVYLYFLE